jgi:hypothetical protein
MRGQDRGVHHVGARPRLEPDRATDPLGERLVPDGTERHVAGERRGRLAECLELAALLVRRDEERGGAGATGTAPGIRGAGPLQCLGQFADLARRAHVVVAEHRHPRRRGVVEPPGDPARQSLALEREHHPPQQRRRRRRTHRAQPLTEPAIMPRTK